MGKSSRSVDVPMRENVAPVIRGRIPKLKEPCCKIMGAPLDLGKKTPLPKAVVKLTEVDATSSIRRRRHFLAKAGEKPLVVPDDDEDCFMRQGIENVHKADVAVASDQPMAMPNLGEENEGFKTKPLKTRGNVHKHKSTFLSNAEVKNIVPNYTGETQGMTNAGVLDRTVGLPSTVQAGAQPSSITAQTNAVASDEPIFQKIDLPPEPDNWIVPGTGGFNLDLTARSAAAPPPILLNPQWLSPQAPGIPSYITQKAIMLRPFIDSLKPGPVSGAQSAKQVALNLSPNGDLLTGDAVAQALHRTAGTQAYQKRMRIEKLAYGLLGNGVDYINDQAMPNLSEILNAVRPQYTSTLPNPLTLVQRYGKRELNLMETLDRSRGALPRQLRHIIQKQRRDTGTPIWQNVHRAKAENRRVNSEADEIHQLEQMPYMSENLGNYTIGDITGAGLQPSKAR